MNTHGIKGEVKVKQISDFNERFQKGNSVYLLYKEQEHLLTIASSRRHKQMLILKFEGFDSINQVEPWKGSSLYITENQLTALEENEYYYHEIIGCEVCTVNGDKIGMIHSILAPGANDVWEVKTEDGREVLIPYIEQVVKEIDIENKKVMIEPMEGLLD